MTDPAQMQSPFSDRPRISAWRVDAAFLGFVIALVAVTAIIAFAWDTTRGKGRTWAVQEASAMTQ